MCPKPNETLSKQSHVEEFPEPVPELFKALTTEPEDKWSTFTFPVDYDNALYGAKNKNFNTYMRKYKHE